MKIHVSTKQKERSHLFLEEHRHAQLCPVWSGNCEREGEVRGKSQVGPLRFGNVLANVVRVQESQRITASKI